jgi:hypothetical protein
VLDDEAKKAYRRRLNELVEELDEAEKNNDLGRISHLQADKHALEEEMKHASGAFGRDRRIASVKKQERDAVRAAIKRCLKTIEEKHADLGRHLRNSLTISTLCRYSPETSVIWQF